MNALLAASLFFFSSCQKPIRKYEQTPTKLSQKMKIMKMLSAATSPRHREAEQRRKHR